MSDDSKTIIFYDFPSKKAGVNGWNPNTWKTRFSLNYKGIPYKTVWVEYPDVEPTLKALGARPTKKKPDGSPMYTLPAISDPSTGAIITESFDIAQYLDKTYPDKPILPQGTKALQAAFLGTLRSNTRSFFPFGLLMTCEQLLNSKSEVYFREVRKNDVLAGKTVDEVYPRGERAKEEWKNVEEGLGNIDKLMSKEDKFIMGDTVSFADFVVGGYLQWAKNGWGEDSEQWKDMATWHGGRWGRLVKALEAL
ncbi:hypothetical protein K435DRAFT_760842 [Dendrothele bispora CBS 962.96]|uniref:GST N-terminal domain-containing protein n=1 Tax=Dendrothele bispora (strain CBS 962.96) TaxID=1314807 RepID=A0A4S8LL06_DENBC|nr:hypothetical protein K435DRAFT_760842 [Dendrothele bispora CBS 962.96]